MWQCALKVRSYYSTYFPIVTNFNEILWICSVHTSLVRSLAKSLKWTGNLKISTYLLFYQIVLVLDLEKSYGQSLSIWYNARYPIEKGEPVFVWVILFTAGYDFYALSGDRATGINMYHLKSIIAYAYKHCFMYQHFYSVLLINYYVYYYT